MTAFTARRRAEEFDSLVEGDLDRSVGRALRRPARARGRAARRARAAGPPEFVAEPARAADGRRRDRARARRTTRGPAHAARRADPPRAPARRRRRRPRDRRRHHLDGRGLPERAAGRRPLPGQAGHRERPDRLQRRRREQGHTVLANAVRPARRDLDAHPRGRGQGRRSHRPHPQHLHRPGHRGLRPAAGRLRGHRARELDRRAARLRRGQHGDPRPTSSRSSRPTPATSCCTPRGCSSRSTPRPRRPARRAAAPGSPSSRRSLPPAVRVVRASTGATGEHGQRRTAARATPATASRSRLDSRTPTSTAAAGQRPEPRHRLRLRHRVRVGHGHHRADAEPVQQPAQRPGDGLIGGDSHPTSNNPPTLPLPGLPTVEDLSTDALHGLTDPLLGETSTRSAR